MCQTLGCDSSEVNTLLDSLISTFKEYSGELDSIAIPGFGTFKTEKSDEYVVTDQKTGERTLFPPKISVSFQPSIVMRKKLVR